MKNKKLFNLNMPKDIYEYLNKASKDKYTTMTQYIINLILEDRKKNLLEGYSIVDANDQHLSEIIKEYKNSVVYKNLNEVL